VKVGNKNNGNSGEVPSGDKPEALSAQKKLTTDQDKGGKKIDSCKKGSRRGRGRHTQKKGLVKRGRNTLVLGGKNCHEAPRKSDGEGNGKSPITAGQSGDL